VGCDTFLQLVGTPHPSPSKTPEFERVDLASACKSVSVADAASVSHFIYLSVAQSSQVMRTLVRCVEDPPSVERVVGVPEIRRN
jgi:hypothetical protein